MIWIERIKQVGPRRWWFFPPIIIGVVILILANVFAPGASHSEGATSTVPVRLKTISYTSIEPRLVGHGEVRPDKVWQAVAQVPGEIVFRHAALDSGAYLEAGTRVMEIEPDDYELALKQTLAQQRSAEARLAELEARAADLKISAEIERNTLHLAESDFQRKQNLAGDSHISALELDAEHQRLLRQRQNVQSLDAQINLLPTQRTSLEAAIAEAEAQVAMARKNLKRTRIIMPFSGRVTAVEVEEKQFAPAGQLLLAAESIEKMEVHLEVPLDSIVSRFPNIVAAKDSTSDLKEKFTAEISYGSGDVSLKWPGYVKRIDPGLNRQTRAARIYVQIDADELNVPPKANLYARVEITGPVRKDQIVIPRFAYHDGVVYLADADNRLVKQPVTVAFRDADRIVIESGLKAGDRLILTDVPYAVTGMSVVDANSDGKEVAP